MEELKNAVLVEFPLRGEWMAPNTPGSRIPSHGTDQLAERYAFDFVRVDWQRRGRPFYQGGLLRYLFRGIPLEKCPGWGEPIYAPCDGEIIAAVDGYPERQRVHWLSDLRVAVKNARTFDLERDALQQVAGNYIIMKCGIAGVYAAFAHLRTGSVAVVAGQRVKQGDVLGKVGHSGNSTAPHLHFQLMDGGDLRSALGIPCAFAAYEVNREGTWKKVERGIPLNTDRIRYYPEP